MSGVILELFGKVAEAGTAPQFLSRSLMTPIGVVAGDVLTYLERRRASTLWLLTRELLWPPHLTMMGVGFLIRAGLIRAVQRDGNVFLQLRKPLPAHVGHRGFMEWEALMDPKAVEDTCVASQSPSSACCSSPALEADALTSAAPS